MRIEIDMIDQLSLKGQIEAVQNYIFYNRLPGNIEDGLNIEKTPKGLGLKVDTSYGNFHVSCHKTKGGIYKFKTWLAV